MHHVSVKNLMKLLNVSLIVTSWLLQIK
jgi:hypothetical protein